jgi:hypothetical protein
VRSWAKWLVLVVVAGNTAAQNEVPDEDFLAFLGGLEADEDWEVFFESVPDDIPEEVALAEDARETDGQDNELD